MITMQPVIPEIDTTEKIWEWYFKASIPYLQSRMIDHIRLLGTPISGIKAVDKELANQWVTTMLTIDQMVELYKRGVPVRVPIVSDTKQIYDFISQHIYAWKQRLERGINIGDAPIEDLIALDEFANIVYEHAKYQFTRETADSLISRHLSSLQRFNASNFFNREALDKLNIPSTNALPGVTRINAQDDNYIPDRDSLSEFFKDRLVNLHKRWN